MAMFLILAALLAPWIAPANPASQDLRIASGSAHRARIGWARTSWAATRFRERYMGRACRCWWLFRWCLVADLPGLIVGMLAGYAGGWFDRFRELVADQRVFVFSGDFAGDCVCRVPGPGISKVILALVITGWAGYARLARAQVLKVKELEFILAARSLGASHARILATHFCRIFCSPF